MRPHLHVFINKQCPCTPLSRHPRAVFGVHLLCSPFTFYKNRFGLNQLIDQSQERRERQGLRQRWKEREKGRKQTQTGRRVDQSAKDKSTAVTCKTWSNVLLSTWCAWSWNQRQTNTQRDRSSCVASRKYLGGGGYFHWANTCSDTHRRTRTGVSRAHKGNVPPSLSRVMFLPRHTRTHGRNPRGSKGAYDSCKTQRHRDLQSATTSHTPEHTLSPRRQFSPRHASAWVFPVSSPQAGGEKKKTIKEIFLVPLLPNPPVFVRVTSVKRQHY